MMIKFKKLFITFVILIFTTIQIHALQEESSDFAEKEKSDNGDFTTMYLGNDKFENYNRKMFLFNGGLNKYVLRPINIIWASIVPKYGMDRIKSAYTNYQYPKRLVSTLLQKDFEGTKTETLRFLTNTTIGLGGMFDPAKSYFKIMPKDATIEQAFHKFNIKQGPFLVLPGFTGATTRDWVSKLIEYPLDPALYISSPIALLAKTGLFINDSTYFQPYSKMVEKTYADPYDIAKKYYALSSYVNNSHLNTPDVLEPVSDKQISNDKKDNEENISKHEEGKLILSSDFLLGINPQKNETIKADIDLQEYKPQTPVVDSMRTALFDTQGMKSKFWSEMAIWNRGFANKIKDGNITVFEGRKKFPYRYILQKDKNAPVAILYPSFADAADTYHNSVFAKILYDEGYSVIFQSNPFHWSFVQSMPSTYRPGYIPKDAEYMGILSTKIVDELERKHNCEFSDKIIVGTSMGALDAMFVGQLDYLDNSANFSKIIAICPPIELTYAMEKIDSFYNTLNSDEKILKSDIGFVAAKIFQLKKMQEDKNNQDFSQLPFSEDEGKFITAILMRQRLTDLLFAIEDIPLTKKTDFYSKVKDIKFREYMEKYVLTSQNKDSLDEIQADMSLFALSDYLVKSDNYKIYTAIDDFYINKNQLAKLKALAGNKTLYFNNGAHMGFIYKEEFIALLKKDVSFKKSQLSMIINQD